MKKGITLVEMLVASILLVIVIGGVSLAVISYNKNIMENVKRKEAIFVLQQEFERIQALGSRQAIYDTYLNVYNSYENSKVETIEDNNGVIIETYKIYFTDISIKTLGESGDLIDGGTAAVAEFTAIATWNNGADQVILSSRTPN